MRKLFLISILLSFVCATHAQTEFSVPTPTIEEKYNTTSALLYNNILALINIAKSNGMTPEELGKRIGEKFPWDEDATFDQLVNFMLYAWTCMSEDVKIIEQSKEKVVITVPHVYPNLEDRGVIYGSSLDDLIAYWDAMMGAIANPLGLSCDWTWGEEGMKVVVAKL
ncbi:MAG: hypothetical protein ABFS32_22805 [Bacteroidota bacterium]